jgi:hypothetical protein
MTTVQLEEAKSLIERGTTPYTRLAFVLLDNAAEIVMFRNIELSLMLNPVNEQILHSWEEIAERTDDPYVHAEYDEMKTKVVSHGKRKKLDLYFDEKVNFLQAQERIEPREGRVLKKLHSYRNELYHRDTAREVTIASACLLYFDLVCSLFENLSQFMFQTLGVEPSPVLAKYGPPEMQWGIPSRRAIVTALRQGLGIDERGLKLNLVTHLASRLDELEESLKYIQDNLFGGLVEKLPSGPRRLAIRLAQVHEEYEYREPPPFEELLKLKLRYSQASITRWKASIKSIDKLNEKLDLFAAFADIEDDFEPFENQVDSLVERLDFQFQREEDLRRGK